MSVLEYFDKIKKGQIKFMYEKNKRLSNYSNRSSNKGYYDQHPKEKETKINRNHFL